MSEVLSYINILLGIINFMFCLMFIGEGDKKSAWVNGSIGFVTLSIGIIGVLHV